MEKQQPEELINKYLSGKATADEKAMLESWYLVHTKNSEDVLPDPEYPLIEQEMWPLIEKKLQPRQKQTRLWPRISIAAAIVLVASGLYFFNKSNRVNESQQASFIHDIPPGKNTATLTLTNGKKIQLSDTKTGVVIGAGSLAYSDGSEVSHEEGSSSEVVQMIASTPRGGQYQFILSDGTKVWLNADSKLEFPSDFKNAKERIVRLEGEGYFEVAKLTNSAGRIPFIVKTDKQVVEVLGTHFNINSYSDEIGDKTTLLEGSVRVSSTQQNTNQAILKPNEQSLLVGSNPITVKKVDVEDDVAWKNGDFTFDNDDLESIMRKIARWYDVEVYYPETPKKSLHFGGVVSRSRSISSVLNSMQSEGQVNFKLQGRKITVIQN
jgi:transmembrane sensor